MRVRFSNEIARVATAARLVADVDATTLGELYRSSGFTLERSESRHIRCTRCSPTRRRSRRRYAVTLAEPGSRDPRSVGTRDVGRSRRLVGGESCPRPMRRDRADRPRASRRRDPRRERPSRGPAVDRHAWNRLPSGLTLDLTREQFVNGETFGEPASRALLTHRNPERFATLRSASASSQSRRAHGMTLRRPGCDPWLASRRRDPDSSAIRATELQVEPLQARLQTTQGFISESLGGFWLDALVEPLLEVAAQLLAGRAERGACAAGAGSAGRAPSRHATRSSGRSTLFRTANACACADCMSTLRTASRGRSTPRDGDETGDADRVEHQHPIESRPMRAIIACGRKISPSM